MNRVSHSEVCCSCRSGLADCRLCRSGFRGQPERWICEEGNSGRSRLWTVPPVSPHSSVSTWLLTFPGRRGSRLKANGPTITGGVTTCNSPVLIVNRYIQRYYPLSGDTQTVILRIINLLSVSSSLCVIAMRVPRQSRNYANIIRKAQVSNWWMDFSQLDFIRRHREAPALLFVPSPRPQFPRQFRGYGGSLIGSGRCPNPAPVPPACSSA